MSIYRKLLGRLKINENKIKNKKTTFDEILAKEIQKENCCIIIKRGLIEQRKGFSRTEMKNK
jgi:hypothetical protein